MENLEIRPHTYRCFYLSGNSEKVNGSTSQKNQKSRLLANIYSFVIQNLTQYIHCTSCTSGIFHKFQL
jgi:hypothetical protein